MSGLHETPLEDDATVVILGVLDDQTHEPPAAPEAHQSSGTGRSNVEPSAGTTIVLTVATTSGKTSMSTW